MLKSRARNHFEMVFKSVPAVLNLFGTRDRFCGRQFFNRRGEGDCFRMFQVYYIYCVLYFYYYISPTSDHQALDPRGWGPLVYTVSPIPANEISSFFLFVCIFIICSVILKNKLNDLFWLITWGLMAAKEKYLLIAINSKISMDFQV